MVVNLREPPADKKKPEFLSSHMETKNFEKKPKSFFEKGGLGVTCHDREILVNWLMLCQVDLCLLPETLQCTVSLIDRFMASSRQLVISEFQLVGVTSMLIASKFHEIRSPTISDFLRLTEDSFTRAAMLEMETRVLKAVDFAVQETVPLPVTLLENLCAKSGDPSPPLADYDSDKLINASYLIDLSLLYAEFLRFSNQDVVLSSLHLSGIQLLSKSHQESPEYSKCKKLL